MKLKNKLITKLKKIKLDTRMDDITYRKMYPTGVVIPKFYGLPKVHKENTPLRPKEELLNHINSVDNAIQFTVEEAKEDGSIPFLDTLIIPEQNGTFSIGSIENQHIQTSTYLGTATTICQPSIVSLRP